MAWGLSLVCEKVFLPKGKGCLLVTSIWPDLYVAARLEALRNLMPDPKKPLSCSDPPVPQGQCRGTR